MKSLTPVFSSETGSAHKSSMCHGTKLQLKEPLLACYSRSSCHWRTVFIWQKESVPFPSSPSKCSKILLTMLSHVQYGFARLLDYSSYWYLYRFKKANTHTQKKTSQERLSKVRPDSWSKWVPFMMKCRDSHECRLGCHSDHNSSCCLPIPHPPPCKVELLVLMIWQSGQLKADKKGIRIKAWRNSFLLKNLLSIWSWLWFLSIHTHRPLH